MRQGQSSRRMCGGNTPPWVHFKLYTNASESKGDCVYRLKAIEMALVRACTVGAAGVSSLSGSRIW